jgi:DNA-binding CsgD family transcriptional regulator
MRLRKLITSAAIGRAGGVLRLAVQWLLEVIPSGVAKPSAFDPRFTNCALVFVTSPKPAISPDWRWIQLVLECTRAEAEVAADLSSGITPTAIATKRNVSLNTIRTQVRILFERTGFHRIAELVGFLDRTR